MMEKLTKLTLIAFAAAGLMVFGVLALSAHAQQMPMQGGSGMGAGANGSASGHFGPGPARIPGIFGKVTAISGTNLTVASMMGRFNASSTNGASGGAGATYSVDASSATILKNGTSSTLSAISVGDMVMVQGTITGDSVAATRIMDGFGGMMRGGMRFGSSTRPSGTFPGGPGNWHGYPSSTASSTGSGQPQPPHGFFGGIMNFFGGFFGHFRF